ncbi:TetR family transcriptional regulator [Pseudonocardia sp. EC080610-09]|uniref:TetR/AcrR family transcriptional regulator n=1 Tax=unclassified Pseudonocardia TaxID=2619320 RepID=UPI0006CB601A|nr:MULTISPECIES: TetR family transcriptional regulator [unclassified Pseudonocardia]ALE73793.1 TetR family transcriptional regulator [Pseudonocardia sp. EC080625-04]ALL77186.1 TetR family transcriptional regulator [Pseudonocardia sp. EC080610-09]ALL80100.1 TetR family transcriptional regulator [Pseudonocardia sp. EC080619-01]
MPRTTATASGADASPAAHPDGRRARGDRRRTELIAATLRVVERDGAAGVTHRAVAREAEAPASLATYYFATLDDLLVAALTDVCRHYETVLESTLASGEDPLTGLARLLSESGTETGRGRALAERELSTLAARRPALRGLAHGWRRKVADIARTRTDDPTAVAALIAAADGLCASVLLADDLPDVDHLRGVLVHALGTGT